ncbi:MAG: S8 family serine peptidase [Chlorobi bacterium]|nr:S8 family serine peptidase [Chlorobiota bacterium]
MRKRFTSFLLVLVLMMGASVFAQTETNVEALLKLSEEFTAQWEANAKKVQQYAKDHNLPVRVELENGKVMEMVDVQDGIPMYYITDNLGAAHTTRAAELWPGGSSGLNLTGEGYDQLGEWDAGAVRVTHQEFTDQGASRVTQMDGNYATNFHSTHVAGTLVAAGVVGAAKGMLYSGKLKSWQWSNDYGEMTAAAAAGLEISNHSYGFGTGWNWTGSQWQWLGNPNIDPNEDYKFGFYDTYARQMDQIAYNAPNYLIFRSAGNDRGEGPGDAGNGKPEKDGGDDGFDCISHSALGKNVMAVGAVKEVWSYTGPQDVVMSSFSCWGPADDGRIKPDIVGKGVGVYSTMNGSDTDYGTLQGTSMSSPNVAGSAALLQYHYQNLNNGDVMRSATLKGLIIHTADEAGPDPGPDYMFGWGLMNDKKAALLISDDQGQNSIDELVLQDGDNYTRVVNVPEGMPELRVTICWTDPPGTSPTPSLNPRDPMLVNDLDLRVSDENSNVYFPYKLDPDNPSAAATNDSENDVDNVEVVVINNPTPGDYTIYIDHDGTLSGGQQAFSLIISGIDEYTVIPECSIALDTPGDGAVDILLNEWISWEPALFATSYDVYFGTDGGGTQTPTNVYNGETITDNGFVYYMEPSTTYYLQIVPRNSQGTANGCNTIWSFTTMDAITEYPYSEDFKDAEVPDAPFGWQSIDNSEATWISTDQMGHQDNASMLCVNPDIVPTDYDNWLITPPFYMEAGKEYNVSYFYKVLFGGTPESFSSYWGTTPFTEDLTNTIYEDTAYSSTTWFQANGIITPNVDGVIFIGFHAASTQGYGIFLDDVEVENWGLVGIGDERSADEPSIYSYDRKIVISAGQEWTGANISVTNLMGQVVYRSTFGGNRTISLNDNVNQGVYVVKLESKDNMVVKKVMIR